MKKDNRNRPDSQSATDDWLTPVQVISAFGQFDLDPCCPATMPWKTAKLMLSNVPKARGNVRAADGLTYPWKGRVWVNPPYSKVLPWVQRMVEHGNGMMLVPAKSTDTAWGQLILETADEVLFQRGRFEFCLPTGEDSGGAWGPSLIAAYGVQNVKALRRALAVGDIIRGVVMKGVTKSVVTKKLTKVA